LGAPLREDRWVSVDAFLLGKSPDLGLSNAEETVFIAAAILSLLSDNHQREVFCQAAFFSHVKTV